MREEPGVAGRLAGKCSVTAGSMAKEKKISVEKWDRDPRLPDDLPPPTLAKASMSKIEKKNNKKVNKTISSLPIEFSACLSSLRYDDS